MPLTHGRVVRAWHSVMVLDTSRTPGGWRATTVLYHSREGSEFEAIVRARLLHA